MGQYYKIINLASQEYLNPWAFGDGAKLLEFGASGGGAMCGLAILLSDGNGRGGGDLHLPEDAPQELAQLVGSWAGEWIVISGDDADKGKYNGDEERNLYQQCTAGVFTDISAKVIELMCFDDCLKDALVERTDWVEKEKLVPALLKARQEKAKVG